MNRLVTFRLAAMDRAPPNLYPPSQSPSAGLRASRTNRLRRSSRTPSQQPPSPATQAPESFETAHRRHKHVMSPPLPVFKTPTRIPPSKYATVFCGESPNNDVEFQQDIVWDANSPSPIRAGKRGKSRVTGAVIGISEIVRRIAPMHGRPEVVEPALQEWIGDSAAIPCTPEVHQPKKKSPRPNGVDDLLKLAKQFDFNMFQQDEEQAEDMHQQTLELLSEDILEYENGFQEEPQLLPAAPLGPGPASRDPPLEPSGDPPRGSQGHSGDPPLEPSGDPPRGSQCHSRDPPLEPSGDPPRGSQCHSGDPPLEPSGDPPRGSQCHSRDPSLEPSGDPPRGSQGHSRDPSLGPSGDPPRGSQGHSGDPPPGSQGHSGGDELELLFDEPTQRVSGTLSQAGFPGSMETSSLTPRTTREAPRCPTPTVSTQNPDDGPAGSQWGDDWGDDDFLNDSLVIEMTQNPLCFAPPKHCSTQNASGGTLHDRTCRGTPGKLGGYGGGGTKNEPRIPKNRTTFKLEAHPVPTHVPTKQSNVDAHARFSSTQSQSTGNRPGSASHLKRHSQPPGGAASKPPAGPQPETPLTNRSTACRPPATAPITPHTMTEHQPTRSSRGLAAANVNPLAVHATPQALACEDLLDLDEVFSSESAWDDDDDDGDDDLLCKMCEDLEAPAEAPERPAAPQQRLSLGNKPGRERAAPAAAAAASSRVGDTWEGHLDTHVWKQPPPRAAPGPPGPPGPQAPRGLRPAEHAEPSPPPASGLPGNNVWNIRTCRVEPSAGPSGLNSCRGRSGGQNIYGPGPPLRDSGQVPFMKLQGPGIKAVHTGPEKCSAAEIERKKLQALERRRQRQQASQQASQQARAPT